MMKGLSFKISSSLFVPIFLLVGGELTVFISAPYCLVSSAPLLTYSSLVRLPFLYGYFSKKFVPALHR